MVLAFYCTPNRKESLGLADTITKYYTLSNEEANQLEDNYDAIDAGEAYAVDILIVLIGAAIKSTAAVIGFGLTAATATAIAQDYYESISNDFEDIAENGQEYTRVKCVYTYDRHGSNDGAYFLTSVKAI